jgi:hypothetical protein
MLIDEPELHREADPKMSAAFFKISRSIRSRSFSRRERATLETRSDSDGAAVRMMGRLVVPVACAENCFMHRRNTVSCKPSSVATFSTDRALLATRSTASRLNASGNIRRVLLI